MPKARWAMLGQGTWAQNMFSVPRLPLVARSTCCAFLTHLVSVIRRLFTVFTVCRALLTSDCRVCSSFVNYQIVRYVRFRAGADVFLVTFLAERGRWLRQGQLKVPTSMLGLAGPYVPSQKEPTASWPIR